MRLGQDVLTDLGRALSHQWLLGNGLGGTSLGDAVTAGARRAHGWLHAPTPRGTRVALLGLEERLTIGDESFELATRMRADGDARPAGYTLLESFGLDPWPVWRWRVAGVTLERSLFLVESHHSLVIGYRHLEGPPVRLVVSPLMVARGPDALQHEDPDFRGVVKGQPGRVRIETVDGAPVLTLWHNGVLLPARLWQREIEHPLDPPEDRTTPVRSGKRARKGAEPAGSSEEALVPAYFEARLSAGQTLHMVAATEDDLFKALAREGRLGAPPPHTLAGCVEALEREERERVARLVSVARDGADLTARQAIAAHGVTPVPGRAGTVLDADDAWVGRLARTLDAGLVRRGHRTTIVASLPRAEERGTPMLRTLGGLIAMRAFDPVAAVLRGTVEYLDEGFAPERIDPDGTPHHGDPEPSLWLIHAADLLARRHGDLELVREGLFPGLESIMQYYRAGTRGVGVDTTGLLAVGEGDARVQPAGLNALWYHALVAMAQLARLVGRKENSAFYLAWAHDHQQRFLDSFWDPEHETLFREIRAAGPVAGECPEHLLAIALPPSLLPADRAVRLLAAIEKSLLTPVGLRPAPGALEARPDWLGMYLSASLRVHGRSAESQAHVRDIMNAFSDQVGMCGQIPERFVTDGARGAWRPAGDIASLPAAAELLRVWIEEIDHAATEAVVG